MSDADPEIHEPHSWRDLDQSVNTRTLSTHGRRRVAAAAGRTLLFLLLTGVFGWGATEVLSTLTNDPTVLSDPAKTSPLREIVLINDADGVLDQAWVEGVLGIPRGTPLMELDLYALREKLLSHPQVRAADLRRDFPGALAVAIQERLPVARIRAQVAGGMRTFLVARDGVVYEGHGYEAHRLDNLPYLDGVRLVRNRRGGFVPVPGMDDVANLLQSAQNAAPQLYRGWRVVSLERLAGYDEIIVRTRDIAEVVFTRQIDYTQQLARLDAIVSELPTVVDFSRATPEAAVKRVDLSLGAQVPVAFENARLLPNAPLPNRSPRNRRDL